MRSVHLGLVLFLITGAVACTDSGVQNLDSEPVLSAKEIDFGFVRQTETKRVEITLSNIGRAPLKISSIERSANLATSFRLAQYTTDVGIGGSVKLQFSFTPDELGLAEGKFTIRTDSKKTPTLEIAVKGTGVETNVRITPELLTFPTLEVGSRATLPITLKNEGDVSETVKVTSEIQTSMFKLSLPDETTKQIALAPGATFQLPVTFEPLGADPAGFVGTVEFQPCPRCASVTVTLKGIGIDSFVTVDPKDCLEFGLVNPGSSLTKPVKVGNLGSRALSILEASIATGNTNFTIEPTELNPIQQDQHQVLNVTYHPSSPISDTGSLKIVTDNPRSPNISVCLRGTGGGPDVRVTPMAIPFGTTAVGVSRDRTLRIENRGLSAPGSDPTLTDVEILDAQVVIPSGSTTKAGEFSVNWPLPIKLSSPNSIQKIVTYLPSDDGDDSAILELTTNDTDTPKVQIALTGTGKSLAPCNLNVYPASLVLDFGAVDPGHDARLQAVLENAGSDQCLIDSLQLSTGTTSAFQLIGGAVNELWLDPGARQYVTIEFDPNGQVATFTGNLEFNVSDPANAHRSIALKAVAAKSCLLFAPDEVNFGAVSAGCASISRSVSLYNSCSKAVSIKSLKFSEDPANRFAVTSAPAWPKTATAASPVKFDIRYVPQVAGDDRGGIFVQTDERPEPYLIPLIGKAVNGAATQEDTWEQSRSPQADILMVVDNSGSMGDEQAALATNFDSFMNYALSTNIDFNLAITTTDTVVEKGQFVPINGSRPRILNKNTPNLKTVFQQNVNVGTNGSADEQGFEGARMALDPAALAGTNAGFLRPNAFLSIIIVSDEVDSSPQSYNYYFAYFMGIKGFRNSNMLSVSVVVDTVTTSYNYGLTYIKMSQDTGGIATDIATQNWSKDLEKISLLAFGRRTRFFLNSPPADPLQISCSIDGVNVPPTQGNITNWWYTSATNSVDFNTIAMPEPDTTLVCTYPVACITP